jgi:hypothetical protein
MKPISLLTEDFILVSKFKSLLKKLLGRYTRGPQSVALSLFTGLSQLGVNFKVNKFSGDGFYVGVLSGVKTLEFAIALKRRRKIKKLVAGPNLVISPLDYDRVLLSPEIDKVLVPSDWVKQAYIQEAPRLAGKVETWPAGVMVPELSDNPKVIDYLVYNKIGQDSLLEGIREYIESKGLRFAVVDYNNFDQKVFFTLLEKSKYMVYLSATESQGIAMFEAWARNVPTLVWERGYFQRGSFRLEGFTASPYVSDNSGRRFRNLNEFKSLVANLNTIKFTPREYILSNFTHKICAEKYLNILDHA